MHTGIYYTEHDDSTSISPWRWESYKILFCCICTVVALVSAWFTPFKPCGFVLSVMHCLTNLIQSEKIKTQQPNIRLVILGVNAEGLNQSRHLQCLCLDVVSVVWRMEFYDEQSPMMRSAHQNNKYILYYIQSGDDYWFLKLQNCAVTEAK